MEYGRVYTEAEVCAAGNDAEFRFADVVYTLTSVPLACIYGTAPQPADYRNGGPLNHYNDGTDDEVLYVRKMQAALDQLPPIVLSSDLRLWDGGHRWAAHADAGRLTIAAFVASQTAEVMQRRLNEDRERKS